MTQDPKKMQIKIIEISPKELEEALVKAKERMDRARTRLLMKREFRFFATLALHLDPQPVPGLGTLGTDGDHLYYDPILVASDQWSTDELIGVNAHEAMHPALLLMPLLRGKNCACSTCANIAADRVINAHLFANNFTLPKGACYQKGDEKRYFEELYKEEHKKNHKDPNQPGQDGCSKAPQIIEIELPSGQKGNQGENYGGTGTTFKPASKDGDGSADDANAQARAQERKWTIIAKQAAAIAQAQGTLPGGFEGLLEPTKSPIDPWSILRQFVDLCRAEDYSYSRPNRRFVGEDLFLPTLYSEGIGELLIGVDTSGSVSDKQLAAALGFVAAVVADVKPERTHLLQCDAGVHSHTIYGDGIILPGKVKVTGRGGTSMSPIWKHAEKNDIHPVVGIVLTDMEMSASDFGPSKGMDFPVLWLNLGHNPKAEAPFGDTVYVELPN